MYISMKTLCIIIHYYEPLQQSENPVKIDDDDVGIHTQGPNTTSAIDGIRKDTCAIDNKTNVTHTRRRRRRIHLNKIT